MIIFLLAAYCAAVFATIAGFGSSTVLIPVATFFMDVKTAVFVVACFHLFNNLFKVRLFFRKIDYQIFITFGIASIIFAFIGAKCIQVVEVEKLRALLGLFIILLSSYSLFKPQFKIPYNVFNSVSGGSLSGFLAGLIGIGGAVRSMFLISFRLHKEVYIATSALIAFVVDLTRIPTYYFGGIVKDPSYYLLLPFLFVIGFAGVWTGKRLLHKIDQQLFQRIVYTVLILMGIKLIFF